MLRIGTVTLGSRVLLCPLAGYTDLAFRRMIRPLGGVGMAYTELVHPRGLSSGSPRSLQIVATHPEDHPHAVQLYGTDPHDLAEAAKWAADRGSPLVDINFGCPVPKVAGKGGGSGILRCCPQAVKLVETLVRAVPVPITVKTRLGWEMGNLVAPALARQLEDVGVSAITIHGRYGEQKFSGKADWEGIAAVVAAVRAIPIIGNGDILSPTDARRMIDTTGCAGVMIGRRALSDPWIFRDTHALLTQGTMPPPPSRRERTELMVRHFELMVEHLGDRRAAIEFRKKMAGYAKMIGPCPKLRRTIPTISEGRQFFELVREFLDELGEWEARGVRADPAPAESSHAA